MTDARKVRGEALARTVASTNHAQQSNAEVGSRRVQFQFLAAKIDQDGPGGKESDGVVPPRGASNLRGLPYVITAAGEPGRVLHLTPKGQSFAQLASRPFNTIETRVPNDVREIEIYLGNDAYLARRKNPQFRTSLNESGVTLIRIHELPSVRLDRLQRSSEQQSRYPVTNLGCTAKLPDDSHVGYLTGDVWKAFSHIFTADDVRRLCGVVKMQRPYMEDRGRGQLQPARSPAAFPPTTTGTPRPFPWGTTTPYPADPVAVREGDMESLTITDWTRVLAPILSGDVQGLVGSRSAQYACYIDLPVLNIRLRYAAGSFSNAIGAGKTVTVADILCRTNPLSYKGALEAAWKSGIDELVLSSTWRPMLGSVLHRLGIGIDVIYVDNYDDRSAGGKPIGKFHVNRSNSPRSALYLSFEKIVFADTVTLNGFKADPWINTDETHRHHMHISAKDPDAQ